jgi:hypothetical protein
MIPSFHASCISIDDTADCLQIGFADHAHGTADYLLLQRAHEVDDQDKRLGMDDVYVERNDQSFSVYGGIAQFELLGDRVRIVFDQKGATNMGGLREMQIAFAVDAERLGSLRAALRRCFAGRACYTDSLA